MTAKLEWTLSNIQQNIEQLQTSTVTINNKSTTTENRRLRTLFQIDMHQFCFFYHHAFFFKAITSVLPSVRHAISSEIVGQNPTKFVVLKCSHNLGEQRHSYFSPPLGPWTMAKRLSIIKFKFQYQFKRF